MKTIAQLLQLKKNPFYKFTPEEQALLDAFLSTQSEPADQQGSNWNSSSSKTPATAHNKNIVKVHAGFMSQINDTKATQSMGQLPGTPTTPR